MPSLLYIGQAPAEGTGSPIVLLRHLERLTASNWKVSVVSEPGQNTDSCVQRGWPVRTWPNRLWWWPPHKQTSDLSTRLRAQLIAAELARATQPRPDALLAYLAAHDDFSAEVASLTAKKLQRPLTLIVHDDALSFLKPGENPDRIRKRHDRIARRAHRIWFATPELAAKFNVPENARTVLPPIPQGSVTTASWQPSFADTPRLVYAGYLWPQQRTVLAQLARDLALHGARLCLLARDDDTTRQLRNEAPVDYIPPFSKNTEALDWLSKNAAAVIVSYAESAAAMPWSATSFPSKLIEYAHLGIPALIVATEETAVARWARRTAYPHIISPGETAPLQIFIDSLRSAQSWETARAPILAAAHSEFSPEKIQQTFESHLL